MNMVKRYFVESEMYPRTAFDNEDDRNEMALALWQEHIYFLTIRVMNWYDDPIMTGIKEDASSNVYTWECVVKFDVPTQVAWFEENRYCAGIAYGEEIICACCGGVTEISDVIDFAPVGVVPIVVYDTWVDFRDEVIGDDEKVFLWDEEDK